MQTDLAELLTPSIQRASGFLEAWIGSGGEKVVQGNLYKFWAPGLEGSNSWVIFLRKTKQNKNVNNHFLVSFFRGICC